MELQGRGGGFPPLGLTLGPARGVFQLVMVVTAWHGNVGQQAETEACAGTE